MLVELAPLFDHKGDYGEDRDLTMNFIGLSNRRDDMPADISNSPRCPKFGDPDPFNLGARITDVKVQRIVGDDKTLEWKIETSSSTAFEQEHFPTSDPAEISWAPDQFQTLSTIDNKRKYMLNTALDLVALPKEDSRWVINVQKHMRRVPNSLLSFNNAINKTTVTVDRVKFKKEKLMCKGLTISKRILFKGIRRSFYYRTVSFQLHFRREGWVVKHPNVGLNELLKIRVLLVDDDGEAKRDSDGALRYVKRKVKRRIMIGEPKEPTLEPHPLKKSGRAVVKPKPTDVYDLKFKVYPTLNFNQLPLR